MCNVSDLLSIRFTVLLVLFAGVCLAMPPKADPLRRAYTIRTANYRARVRASENQAGAIVLFVVVHFCSVRAQVVQHDGAVQRPDSEGVRGCRVVAAYVAVGVFSTRRRLPCSVNTISARFWCVFV